jgi:hypothetical protein
VWRAEVEWETKETFFYNKKKRHMGRTIGKMDVTEKHKEQFMNENNEQTR